MLGNFLNKIEVFLNTILTKHFPRKKGCLNVVLLERYSIKVLLIDFKSKFKKFWSSLFLIFV